jgi:hypothetical protein
MRYTSRVGVLVLLALLAYVPVIAQERSPDKSSSVAQPVQEPPPEPQADAKVAEEPKTAAKATVYIYRPKKLVGAALEPSVFCDGVEIGRMDNGRYIMLRVAPGTHRFHMTDKGKRVEETLKSGQVIYVRFRLEPGMWKAHGNLFLADEGDALKELKDLKPLGADKIKDRTMVVTDSAEAEAETKKRVSEFATAKKG